MWNQAGKMSWKSRTFAMRLGKKEYKSPQKIRTDYI